MSDVRLIDITPPSISHDAQIQALAEAFDFVKATYMQLDVLQVLTNIERLTGSTLDLVAWQFHVDGYNEQYSDDVKRKMILSSVEIHRKKGTPWAVQRAVESVFNTGKIEEWFNYNADPYHFKVSGITEKLTDARSINSLVTLINTSKNTRSWLDYIEFINELNPKNYMGCWVDIEDVYDIQSDLSNIEEYILSEYATGCVEDTGTIDIYTKVL